MRWSGATGAIARCQRVSTGCGRKYRAVRVLRWICGVKPKPKAGNKPLPHFILRGLDKPGSAATVSCFDSFLNTLETWLNDIANYFMDRHTSGFVEGFNNKLKVIKRRCYGILNVTHLFQRIQLDFYGHSLFALKIIEL